MRTERAKDRRRGAARGGESAAGPHQEETTSSACCRGEGAAKDSSKSKEEKIRLPEPAARNQHDGEDRRRARLRPLPNGSSSLSTSRIKMRRCNALDHDHNAATDGERKQWIPWAQREAQSRAYVARAALRTGSGSDRAPPTARQSGVGGQPQLQSANEEAQRHMPKKNVCQRPHRPPSGGADVPGDARAHRASAMPASTERAPCRRNLP
ncbi:hypothetical protein DFH09DRAFT_1102259 [Mycena vulgaris]|nr:hypothetical protein DFH09DRAFT_1102259 [Mycena vulgaris]